MYREEISGILISDDLFKKGDRQDLFEVIDRIDTMADLSLCHLYSVTKECIKKNISTASIQSVIGYLAFTTLRMRHIPVFVFNNNSKKMLQNHVVEVASLFEGERFSEVGKLILKPQKIHRYELFTWVMLYMNGSTKVPEHHNVSVLIGLDSSLLRFKMALKAYDVIRTRPADKELDMILLNREEYEGILDFYTFASCTISQDERNYTIPINQYGICSVMTFIADCRKYRLGLVCR